MLFGTHANYQTAYVLTLYPHEKARAPEPSLIFVACFTTSRKLVVNSHPVAIRVKLPARRSV